MASIHRQTGTQYWIAHYTDKRNQRRSKSTKLKATNANRKAAQAIADSFEDITRARNAVRALRDSYASIAADLNVEWRIPTVEAFLHDWIQTYGPRLAESSRIMYALRFKSFVDFLNDTGKPGLFVDMVDTETATAFRARLIGTVSAATVNVATTVLSGAFSHAQRKGYIVENPFLLLGSVEETDSVRKEAFTREQVEEVLRHCDGEWRSLVMFGVYTGQRLGDIATLTWNQVDTARSRIAFTTKKTKRPMELPIAAPLRAFVDTLPKGKDNDPVHPRAARLAKERGNVSQLSRMFGEILQQAGLAPKKTHQKAERVGARRVVSPLSFHSLRHALASWLRDTGATESTSMEVVGHSSVSVDRAYVHSNPEAMQTALDKLPVVNWK